MNVPAVLKMYCQSAIVIFCKPTVTFWELSITFTKEMYKNMYCTVFGTVSDKRWWGGTDRGMLHSAEREM